MAEDEAAEGPRHSDLAVTLRKVRSVRVLRPQRDGGDAGVTPQIAGGGRERGAEPLYKRCIVPAPGPLLRPLPAQQTHFCCPGQSRLRDGDAQALTGAQRQTLL